MMEFHGEPKRIFLHDGGALERMLAKILPRLTPAPRSRRPRAWGRVVVLTG